jgi:hypothetical protein
MNTILTREESDTGGEGDFLLEASQWPCTPWEGQMPVPGVCVTLAIFWAGLVGIWW